MKILLLSFTICSTLNLFAQNITYYQNQIFLNDTTVLFEVIELKNNRPLVEADYDESDSSNTYDYKFVDSRGFTRLELKYTGSSVKSSSVPGRNIEYHQVFFGRSREFIGEIGVNELSIFASGSDYRTYLIDFLIDNGLLNSGYIDQSTLSDFRYYHRDSYSSEISVKKQGNNMEKEFLEQNQD